MIKLVAVKEGMADSPVVERNITILEQVEKPYFHAYGLPYKNETNADDGTLTLTYIVSVNLNMYCPTPNTTIYYSTGQEYLNNSRNSSSSRSTTTITTTSICSSR